MNNSNKIFCCDLMSYYLDTYFNSDKEVDDPDVIIKYIAKFDEYGIPIHDGGSSMIEVKFCPWCGAKLPESKRDLWFDELEKLNINIDNEDEIPEQYRSSKWYDK
jgi:hypothetical protein